MVWEWGLEACLFPYEHLLDEVALLRCLFFSCSFATSSSTSVLSLIATLKRRFCILDFSNNHSHISFNSSTAFPIPIFTTQIIPLKTSYSLDSLDLHAISISAHARGSETTWGNNRWWRGVSAGLRGGGWWEECYLWTSVRLFHISFLEIALLLSLFLLPHLLPLVNPATNSRTRLIQLGKQHHCTNAPLTLSYLLFSSFSMNPSPFLLVLRTYHSQNFLVVPYSLGLL